MRRDKHMHQNHAGTGDDNRPFSLRELKQVQKSRITARRLQTLRSNGGERERMARALLEQAECQARMDAEARVRERFQFNSAAHRRRAGWAAVAGVLLVGAGVFILLVKTNDVPLETNPPPRDTQANMRVERALMQMVQSRTEERQRLDAQLQALDERVNLMTSTLRSIAEKARAHRSHRRAITAYTVSSSN